jgi:hypothetical protein
MSAGTNSRKVGSVSKKNATGEWIFNGSIGL